MYQQEQAFAFTLYRLPNNIFCPMTEAFQWVQEHLIHRQKRKIYRHYNVTTILCQTYWVSYANSKGAIKRESKRYTIYETTFRNNLLYVQQVLSNTEGFYLSFCTQPWQKKDFRNPHSTGRQKRQLIKIQVFHFIHKIFSIGMLVDRSFRSYMGIQLSCKAFCPSKMTL